MIPPSRRRMLTIVLVAMSICTLGGGAVRDGRAEEPPPAMAQPSAGDGPVSPDRRPDRVNPPAGPGPVEAPDQAQPWAVGDDARLDDLRARCGGGSGVACDELFETAPVGSDHERYGLTCGDRPAVVNCTDLDEAAGD